MTPVKVIVQGLSLRSDASGHEEVCNKGYKKKLERVLAMYGPVRCTYLWADETHSSPPPDIIDNFAHVYYKNEEDAVRASQAASNHEVQLDDCILTLTLVSRSLISIDILDNDCLLQIFSKLDLEDRLRIEEVCPHWKELAQHSWSSMKRLDLEFVSVTEAQFETYLIKCGEYLEELVCKIVSAYSIALITTHCENLKALDLTIYSTFSNHTASLSQMLKKFDNLISFKCDHSISTAYNMFEDLPSSIKELSVICRYWQPTGVIRDFERFQNLETLVIRGYDIFCLNGIEHLTKLTHLDFSMSTVRFHQIAKISNLAGLRKLYIPGDHVNLNDPLLIEILKNLRALEYLDIAGQARLTDDSLQLISMLPNLKGLDVSGLKNVTFKSMNELTSLVELVYREVHDLSDEGLCRLVRLAPNLRFLDVTGSNVTANLFSTADVVVKKRGNNVILKIIVDEIINDLENVESLSPLLKIEFNIKRNVNCAYDDLYDGTEGSSYEAEDWGENDYLDDDNGFEFF